MQQLAGPDKVRYLAENAGSMDPIHFTAFCQLLKLDPKDPKKYLWDAFAYGAPIQRGRNFFRGHTVFFALCCLGKIPGGAPFSQLHKSGNGSRVDRP